jgi:hypothetical protein
MNARLLAIIVWLSMADAVAASDALGTSAAVDSSGRLWVAYAEAATPRTHVVVVRSDDDGKHWGAAIRVTSKAAPVSADGENRPKLAFGPQGDVYVSWTSPTSAQYTADIRFARSLDGGATWSAPVVVHRDRQVITHRFESMVVGRDGRIWTAWIDKRDLAIAQAAQRDYAGAAVYYAYSDDRGATWRGDFKVADQSCECCRIALATDAEGRALALWRHVFAGSERDHAIAELDPQRDQPALARATFDRWRIDACPHQGPGLAVARDGTRHAVWFNHVAGQGRAFYGQLARSGPQHVRELPGGASHADVAVLDDLVALAWKRFDGEATRVESWISRDAGRTFTSGPTLTTTGASDQPRVVSGRGEVLLVWRRAEGTVASRLTRDSPAALSQNTTPDSRNTVQWSGVKPFDRNTLARIERTYRGESFWLVLWDLECTYCVQSLRNLAAAQRARPALKVVTIATDSIADAAQLAERLAELGVSSEAYAFADGAPEGLRYAIDPEWLGEKPRAYRYEASGARESRNGVIDVAQFR